MKICFQVFLVFAFFANAVFAADLRDMKKILLKKDAQKKILVKYETYEKLFKFRWTLYTNDVLVVFHSYDRNVAQTILTKTAKHSNFRVELKTRGADYHNVPYMLVRFKEFDYEKNEAEFDILFFDKKNLVKIIELPKAGEVK